MNTCRSGRLTVKKKDTQKLKNRTHTRAHTYTYTHTYTHTWGMLVLNKYTPLIDGCVRVLQTCPERRKLACGESVGLWLRHQVTSAAFGEGGEGSSTQMHTNVFFYFFFVLPSLRDPVVDCLYSYSG